MTHFIEQTRLKKRVGFYTNNKINNHVVISFITCVKKPGVSSGKSVIFVR